MTHQLTNYLTIDVEDYFQVAAFEDLVTSAAWSSMECRVERNTASIFDILGKQGVRATFLLSAFDRMVDFFG